MIFDSKVVFFFMCLLGLHKCRLATDGLQLEFRGKSILSNQSLLLELQLLFQDPCVELRCSSNEICVSNDANSAGCVPKQQIDLFAEYYLNKRETNEPETAQVSTEFVSPCNSNDCRYGECEILNLTSFKCHCVVVISISHNLFKNYVDLIICPKKGVTGDNCNYLSTSTNPCSSNPCFGEAACINLSNNKFVCICKSGRAGPACRAHLTPCQCTNGGVCRLIDVNAYECDCPQGYA